MRIQEAILEILHPTIWRRGLSIYQGVVALEYRSKRPFRNISLGRFYYNLRSLEQKGLVESKEAGLDQETLERRGGRPGLEYRLTKSGTGKRYRQRSSDQEGLPAELLAFQIEGPDLSGSFIFDKSKNVTVD